MGVSFSAANRRRNNAYHHHPPPPPPPYQCYNTHDPMLPYPVHPPPPPPPPPLHPSYCHSNQYNVCNHANHLVGPSTFGPFCNNFHHQYHHQPPVAWPAAYTPSLPEAAPPPYVDHREAKKVQNHINVHKDTLRLEVDEHRPDHHLVSFVFDALFDGSITIFYFAKEEPNCSFTPLLPEVYMPAKFSFKKGLGQKFLQPSGTGIDLGFFELDELSKPSSGEDVFPLVISAETSPQTACDDYNDPMPNTSPHVQITQAVLQKDQEGPFSVRVQRQILWIDNVRYELRDLFGIGNSAQSQSSDGNDSGKDCVICLTEAKDTAVLPCRHMCMCNGCAKELRLQSNRCPICRQPIEELMEIKISDVNQ